MMDETQARIMAVMNRNRPQPNVYDLGWGRLINLYALYTGALEALDRTQSYFEEAEHIARDLIEERKEELRQRQRHLEMHGSALSPQQTQRVESQIARLAHSLSRKKQTEMMNFWRQDAQFKVDAAKKRVLVMRRTVDEALSSHRNTP